MKWRLLVWAAAATGLVMALVPHPAEHVSRKGQPPLTGDLELRLTLSAAPIGRCMPIVTTGRPEAGTLLFIKFIAPETIVFGYDSWGAGGPVSDPIRIEPGRTEDLLVRMPAIAGPRQEDPRQRGPLRVDYGQRRVLDAAVRYHGLQLDEVFFGENPIGGTVTNDMFRGKLSTRSGELLRDHPDTFRSRLQRALGWIRREPLGAALGLLGTMLVASLAVVLAKRMLLLRRAQTVPIVPGRTRRPHAVFAVLAGLVVALFAAVITGGRFDLFSAESFSRFYDDQASGLLRGRLDVPPQALDGEAFVFRGKSYGYFGPTPALLRIPFNLAGWGYGRLTRSLMVVYFAACLAAAYALLIHAARCAGGPGAWPGRMQVALLVLGAGVGSSLFFLGSRAYVYHEAILCGAAFALWSVWATLRWLQGGGRGRSWLAALGCGLLSVHARPPSGLFALATLGCACAFLLHGALRSAQVPRWPGPSRFAVIGMLAVVGVFSFNALSYLKFRSFDGAPLRYHVQYGPERLANIEGRNFHLGNVPYGLAGYVWRPNVLFRPTFPYVYIHGTDPSDFPGSRIDLAENTLALPWAMPALTLLAALGFGVMWLRWPGATVPLAVLAGGIVPVVAAILAAVAQSHRYTADFVPFLVAAAAFGLAGTDVLTTWARRCWLALAAILTPAAIILTLAITLHYQGEGVWGVSDEIKSRYLAMRRWSDQVLGLKP
jgi:hypothetical protein